MYEINVKIGAATDAERASRVFSAMAEAWDSDASTAAAEPRARRTRRTTESKTDDAKPDAAALYDALSTTATELAPTVTTATEPAPTVTTATEPAPATEPTPAPAASRDELLSAVRAIAQQRGALWVREVIASNKAGKLSDLSDQVLQQLIDAEALA